MRTVLTVEDHTDTTNVLVEALRLAGWDAVGAGSSEKALHLARGVRLDVVLADLLLPGMDGEALERGFEARFATTELLAAMERAVATAEARTWTQGPRAETDDPHLN